MAVQAEWIACRAEAFSEGGYRGTAGVIGEAGMLSQLGEDWVSRNKAT